MVGHALASLFKERFGWDIGPENVAITNGSQSSFYTLFHLFAGEYSDHPFRKILLPLTPEYIGYSDIGMGNNHPLQRGMARHSRLGNRAGTNF